MIMAEGTMFEYSLSVVAAISIAAIGFFAGQFWTDRKMRRISAERDEIRALLVSSGVDFGGIREVGKELLNDAAAISATATRLAQFANAADGDTSSQRAASRSFALICAASGCANSAPTYIMAFCKKCNRNWCSRHATRGNSCPGCGHKYLS
jgi:hypothetical protein